MNKKEFIRISLPKETYNLLTNKIQQMNYINLKEYILKKLLIDLLNENLSNININNDKIVIFNPSGVSGDSWVTINKLKNATNFKDIRNNEIVKTRFINNEQQVY
ncbi:MAG: hypothetical protein N2485_08485, partial [bacterium]|nr:hypothetical protein [bacterium]